MREDTCDDTADWQVFQKWYNVTMTQEEAVSHWQKRAQAELKAARTLLESKQADLYGEVLFHCHLALELALKSEYIREKDTAAPYTHDLNELASSLKNEWDAREQDVFEEITEAGILSRYGDEEWYRVNATKERAEDFLRKTERLLSMILQYEKK